MRRKKRFTILRIAFAVAAVAIFPVTAQAKPMPTGGQDRLGTSETPYLTQDVGVALAPDNRQLPRAWGPVVQTSVGTTPDDRPYSRATGAVAQRSVGTSPDDRPYSRATTLESTPVVTDGGTTIDIDAYAVTGFGLALLLVIGGTSLAIRHTRKGRLSPA